jgi:diguanylate cyclase (GGDEF)-like protein
MNQTFDPHGTTQILQIPLSDLPRVLLVDDDELVLERLRALITTSGFGVEIARDGLAALAALQAHFAPIVIADRRMPGMDGLALCRTIRRDNWPGYVYILLLTAQDAEEDILAGLEAGADDYLSKRASAAQLLARLRTASRILSLEHSLKQALEEKRRLSLTDPLTGCANRRCFMKHLSVEFERARRAGEALNLVSLDIDHFKRINDRYGHATGDLVLQEFVRRVNQCLQPQRGWCARVGGEEFAVVAGGGLTSAQRLAEAIRAAAASAPVATPAGDIPSRSALGWLVGIATCATRRRPRRHCCYEAMRHCTRAKRRVVIESHSAETRNEPHAATHRVVHR